MCSADCRECESVLPEARRLLLGGNCDTCQNLLFFIRDVETSDVLDFDVDRASSSHHQ